MEISHQTQGGKFGVNPALSRSCNEAYASKSECPPKVTDKLIIHLRGTGEYCHKYFKDTSVSRSYSARDTPRTTHGYEIIGSLLIVTIVLWCNHLRYFFSSVKAFATSFVPNLLNSYVAVARLRQHVISALRT